MVEVNFGDVIFVERDCGIFGYRHFGIYSGERKVIHYVKEQGDPFDGVIRETSLTKFLKGDECYVCSFDQKGTRTSEELVKLPAGIMATPRISVFDLLKGIYDIYSYLTSEGGKIYSPEETVARARRQIGTAGYNLALHNCEHFAVWCKTGLNKSKQVEEFLDALASAGRY